MIKSLNILFFAFYIILVFQVKAQYQFSNVGKMSIGDGEVLSIVGDFKTQDLVGKDSSAVFNLGEVILKSDLINESYKGIIGNGRVAFTGNKNQTIRGNKLLEVKTIDQNNGLVLFLENNVSIKDSVILSNGILNVGQDTLYLVNDSVYLTDETFLKYVTGSTGAIKVRKEFNFTNSINSIGTLGIRFMNSPGKVPSQFIYRMFESDTSVANGSINRVYRIEPIVNGDTFYFEEVYVDYLQHEVKGNEILYGVFATDNSDKKWTKIAGVTNLTTNVTTGLNAYGNKGSLLITIADTTCDTYPIVSLDEDTINVCEGDTARLSAGVQNIGNRIKWFPSNENSVEIQRYLSGYASVKVTDKKGCSTIKQTYVKVRPNPDSVAFQIPPLICAYDSLDIKNKSPFKVNYTYKWKLGDGDSVSNYNFKHLYDTSGVYRIDLEVLSDYNCSKKVFDTIRVAGIPKADFSFNAPCDFENLILQDQSSLIDLSNSSILNSSQNKWQFDGLSKDTIEFSIEKVTPGNKTVSLKVMSSAGCVDSVSKLVTVNPLPILQPWNFSSTVCLNDSVHFKDSSYILNGSFTRKWEFGDGDISSLIEVNNQYPDTGNFFPKLTLVSDQGCIADSQWVITVNQTPTSSFNVDDICFGEVLEMSNNSIGNIDSSIWQVDTMMWKDVSLKDTVLTGLSVNRYEVRLKVFNNLGCSAESRDTINVFEKPKSQFTSSNLCVGDTLRSTNQSMLNQTNEWRLNNVPITNSTQLIYEQAILSGNYNLALIVASSDGCKDTSSQSFIVYDSPVLNWDDTTSSCVDSVILNASIKGASYDWSTGANTASISINTEQNIFVTVSDSNGCKVTDSTYTLLNTALNLDLGPDTSVCGEYIRTVSTNFSKVNWSSGDTTRTVTLNSSIKLSAVVEDKFGCEARDTIEIIVHNLPNFSLGADTFFCESEIYTIDKSGVVGSIKWNTNHTGKILNVDSSITLIGTLTDTNQCSSNDTVIILEKPILKPKLPESIANCSQVSLDAGIINAQYRWNTGDTTK